MSLFNLFKIHSAKENVNKGQRLGVTQTLSDVTAEVFEKPGFPHSRDAITRGLIRLQD